MKTEEIYDFCADWLMGQVSKKELIQTFIEKGWEFDTFLKMASKKKWVVNSMHILLYANDFK